MMAALREPTDIHMYTKLELQSTYQMKEWNDHFIGEQVLS